MFLGKKFTRVLISYMEVYSEYKTTETLNVLNKVFGVISIFRKVSKSQFESGPTFSQQKHLNA